MRNENEGKETIFTELRDEVKSEDVVSEGATEEVFQSHIVKHAREGCAQCKECGASFAVEPSWRKHLLLVHGVKLPGLEDICQDLAPGEGSSDYQDFDDDEEVEGEKEEGGLVMVCAGCENRFSSQTGLEEHR